MRKVGHPIALPSVCLPGGSSSINGFLNFELIYGRHVRGPQDVLKETWETGKRSFESVVSYVLAV